MGLIELSAGASDKERRTEAVGKSPTFSLNLSLTYRHTHRERAREREMKEGCRVRQSVRVFATKREKERIDGRMHSRMDGQTNCVRDMQEEEAE